MLGRGMPRLLQAEMEPAMLRSGLSVRWRAVCSPVTLFQGPERERGRGRGREEGRNKQRGRQKRDGSTSVRKADGDCSPESISKAPWRTEVQLSKTKVPSGWMEISF